MSRSLKKGRGISFRDQTQKEPSAVFIEISIWKFQLHIKTPRKFLEEFQLNNQTFKYMQQMCNFKV